MSTFVLFLFLLIAVLASSLLDRVIPKVSLPLVQIGLGIIIGLFASTEVNSMIDPNMFILIFIAPLIFDESRRMDKAALWHNRKPVLSLAIGLVVVACLAVGFAVNALIPSIPLAVAFALAAALGPTDAVAVSSLAKEVNIDSQDQSVLEAESIINDASGIVTFQFALAAVTTGAFSLFDASVSFVFSFFGGILVGAVIALVAGFIIRRIRAWGFDNTTFHVLYEICLPFVVYLVANNLLGVSGILALVAAGALNILSPKNMGPAESRLNIVSNSVWKVVTFTLNGVVFVILGALLPQAMTVTWASHAISNVDLIYFVAVITLLLTAIRFAWVFVMRILSNRKKRKEQGEERLFSLNKEDVRHSFIMTFSGARGAITLALMLSIPAMIGADTFPQRQLITFLAAGVIVLTLLIATFIVPLIAPKKEENEEEMTQREEHEIIIEILRNVIEDLTAQENKENRQATQAVIRSYNTRIERIKDNHDIEVESQSSKDLRIKALRWEQDCVIEMIDANKVDPVIGYQHINRMAQIQNLLKHRSENTWMIRNAFRHLRLFWRSLRHTIDSLLPNETIKSESAEAARQLQITCSEYVIDRLQDEMSNPDRATEDVSNLLLEYQRILSSLKNTRLSVTAIAKNAEAKEEVERRGLRLELEHIEEMYEADKLSRSAYRRLRENVSLMQLDIEDHI